MKQLKSEALLNMLEDLETEKKKAKESEEKYRNLTENMRELVYIADPKTFVANFVNKAVEDVYGYTAEEWLSDPKFWENSIHPDDRDRAFAEFSDAQKKGKNRVVEYRIIPKNKEIKWVQDHITWIKDKKGKLISLQGVILDVTEQKKAEEQLKESEERLRFLVSSNPAAIYISKAGGNYAATFMSENVKKLTGYNSEDFIKNPNLWENNIHPDNKKSVFNNLKDLFKKVPHINEYRFKHKDGNYVWIRDEINLIKDEKGKPKEIIGYWTDITERKKTEEKIESEKNKLMNVIEGITDVVGITDIKGKIIQINKAVESWGFKKKELIGKPTINFIARRSLPKLEQERKKTLKTGVMKNFELIGLKKNKAEFPMLVSVTLMKDAAGKPVGRVFLLKDITEQKKTEEKLKKSEEKLKALQKK